MTTQGQFFCNIYVHFPNSLMSLFRFFAFSLLSKKIQEFSIFVVNLFQLLPPYVIKRLFSGYQPCHVVVPIGLPNIDG